LAHKHDLNVRYREIVLRRRWRYRDTVEQPTWISLHQHQAGLSAQLPSDPISGEVLLIESVRCPLRAQSRRIKIPSFASAATKSTEAISCIAARKAAVGAIRSEFHGVYDRVADEVSIRCSFFLCLLR
jgi:hypothetical protein